MTGPKGYEVQCPICKEFRMATRRNKYDNRRIKLCRACVPKAYPPLNVRKREDG